jgi:hypothetical protein
MTKPLPNSPSPAQPDSDAAGDRAIARIRKNSREQLYIDLSNYKGVELVNFRVWYDAGNGEMRPGKAGLAMRVEALPELAAALEKATEQARTAGLI